ncbi:MAG: hypothetical protein AB7F98_17680 [Novosphingobium sp.]
MMAIDLTGGLDASFEHFLTEAPVNPAMRDAAIMWVMDRGGEIALPRFSIDAIGEDWGHPVVTLNGVFADGRTLKVWERFAAHADNGGAVLGAGPLRFECVEPFRKWQFAFDGEAGLSTTEEQMAGGVGSSKAQLAFQVEAEMAEPPWLMGGMTAEAAKAMKASGQTSGSALMGGHRYEQLCRVRGWLRFDGKEHKIEGTGMRVRRQGVRNMAGSPGHCQHSVLFSSGKAFGANVFWPDAEGNSAFNEGFVMLEDGRRLAARVVEAPWMLRLEPAGDSAPLLLETVEGHIRIEAQTLLKMFDHHFFEMADTSVLEQGVARYRWDGEEAIGLIERCTLNEKLERSARHG